MYQWRHDESSENSEQDSSNTAQRTCYPDIAQRTSFADTDLTDGYTSRGERYDIDTNRYSGERNEIAHTEGLVIGKASTVKTLLEMRLNPSHASLLHPTKKPHLILKSSKCKCYDTA